jgi:hypothetical protein
MMLRRRVVGGACLALWFSVGMSIAPAPASASVVTQILCLARAGSGTIAGRLALASPPIEAGVRIFRSSEAGDMYLDTLKQVMEQEKQMSAASGDSKRMQAKVVGDVLASSERGAPTTVTEAGEMQATAMRRLQMVREFMPLIASAPTTGLDQRGAFTCKGLKPGSYDLLAEVKREVPAPASMGKDAPDIQQRSFYVAKHVLVPKSKGGTSPVVRVTRFVLLGSR